MDSIQKIAGGLFLIIGLIWAAAYVYSRLTGTPLAAGRGFIRVIASSHIGQKQSISVVCVAGEYLVLGVTPGNINLLAKIESADAVKTVSDYADNKSAGGILGPVHGLKPALNNTVLGQILNLSSFSIIGRIKQVKRKGGADEKV